MTKELTRLASVLRQIADDAGYAFLCRGHLASVRFCATQYNRIHTRLMEIDPDLTSRSSLLPNDAPPSEVRIFARTLASLIVEKLRKEQHRSWFNLECFAFPWTWFNLKFDFP